MAGKGPTKTRRAKQEQGERNGTTFLPEVNIIGWNTGGLKNEAKTLLLLDHIKTEWPDTHLILLAETHLEDDGNNTILEGNKEWEVCGKRLSRLISCCSIGAVTSVLTGGITAGLKHQYHTKLTN